MIAVNTDLTPLCDAEDVLYTAVVLDKDSQDRILSIVPPFEHGKEFGHHVTLAFKPSQEHIDALDVGKRVAFTAKAIVMNSKCIAVEVSLPEGVESNNKHPHVTICTRDGVPPVYSNKLLEDNSNGLGDNGLTEYPLQNMVLNGRIEFKMKS
mgnify:CR=1 FL=1|tara:strand:- start:333 stop:788 length:456 start_codon:yes stop_codon:yes gene_type:complete